ncbi:hypothetical protein [Okeania sp. SIO2B3]|uniref:hypothetical protein n=1 Tax=Okeania sp. SIO2B3 TaxID=2607784 RepID=UPI0013C1837B|nr:hypothetical protein [Okeania sp. SIO2B3]NET45480.1 hypothetical protein [Okeania sp. SIO2B3]
MTNTRFLNTAEKQINFLIIVIGVLLIIIAVISSVNDALETIFSSVGGVLIGTGITGSINQNPLQKVGDSFERLEKNVKNTLQINKEEITKYIENLSKEQTKLIKYFQEKVRISCDDRDKNRLDSIDKKEQYYRYFQTLNSDGNWEWRMKPLSFHLSDDGKRVNASIGYKHNFYFYNIQASYIGKHFVLFAEESSGLSKDNPMIEIYPEINFGKEQTFSGISIRYPWDRPNNPLITLSILSESKILEEHWEEDNQGYWIIKDTNRDKTIKEMGERWDSNMKDIQTSFKRLI